MPSNSTHRKKLARALAAATDLSYQQAHTVVVTADEAGRLPHPLDAAGQRAALSLLLGDVAADALPTSFPARDRAGDRPAQGTALAEFGGSTHPFDSNLTARGRAQLATEAALALYQVRDLHRVGVALTAAVEEVHASCPHPRVQEALASLGEAMAAPELADRGPGASAEAAAARMTAGLAPFADVFPPVTVRLLVTGFLTGALGEALGTAAAGLERDARLRQQL